MNTNNETINEDILMSQINSVLPKSLIQIIKIIAALSTKSKNNAELEPYIIPLLQLLTNIINIKKDPVLTTIKSKLELLLTTYLFYINEILTDQLDTASYIDKHEQLVYFNSIVKKCVRIGNCTEVYEIII